MSYVIISCFLKMLPVVAYKTPGYNRESLNASREDVKEVPVTMSFVTPIKYQNINARA